MGLFDFKLWRKLTGPRVAVANYALSEHGQASVLMKLRGLLNRVPLFGLGTEYMTGLDISGKGYLLLLAVEKPQTTGVVDIQIRMTLDGTVVTENAPILGFETNNTTAAVLVGQVQTRDAWTPILLPPVFLPFNRSIKMELKYSGDPGETAAVMIDYLAVYN